jgi:hypothetical protein
MTQILGYKSKLRIIELVYTGNTTGLDLRESTSKAIALDKEKGSLKFLVDATEIELTASIFDLYDLPARHYHEENLDRQSHVAVILPKRPKEQKDAQFYETACVNRGWFVKLVSNREEGIDWLMGTDSSNKTNTDDC